MLPALPYMGEALGVADENERQFVISAYMMGFGIGPAAFGPLSDRFGRRAPLLVGIGIYIVAVLAAASAPSFAVLLALRFVQGLGASGTRVIATAVVRDRFCGPRHGRGHVAGLHGVHGHPHRRAGHRPGAAAGRPMAEHLRLHGRLWRSSSGSGPSCACPRRSSPRTAAACSRPGRSSEGFRIVVTNRMAFCYGLAGTFLFGALFGFISTAQQIYVDIYGLGV